MGKKHDICPVERSGSLEGRMRRIFQNPRKILKDYVREGMVVLDVGCGPGFFSMAAAKMVGDRGKVIAVDVQEGMLEKLRKKISGTEIEKRIDVRRSGKSEMGIKEKVDFVMAFYVFHEIEDHEKFLDEVKSILRPDGTFFIAEPTFRVSKEEFEETLEKITGKGFRLVKTPRIILSRAAVFRKTGPSA